MHGLIFTFSFLYMTDAGHYIPAIATTIQENNAKNTFPLVNLKSIMIGNGLTDPLTQYGYYKDMACEPSSYGTLVSSQKVCQDLESYQHSCRSSIQQCYNQTDFSVPATNISVATCILSAQICNTLLIKTVLDLTNSTNTYDVRRPCEGN
jgi:cathepsin A (carboxypeptidase C)